MSNTQKQIERIIDANINRLREGLRVLEDINRYIWNNSTLSKRLKSLRHKVATAYNIDRLLYRDIEGDVSKESIKSEMNREDLKSIIIANFSRSQESARVLEEIFKLQNLDYSSLFKNIRYELYSIEREVYLNYFKSALANRTSKSK